VVKSKDDLWQRIVGLAQAVPTVGPGRLWKKSEPTRQTDLVSDLGLVGDDAFEFMEKFAELFGVDKGDFDSAAYFDAEGLSLLPSLKKKAEKKRITLGMLELAARDGKWNSQKLDQARLDGRYE
jgi:hypothetical protein